MSNFNPTSTEGVESAPQACLCSNGCGFFANMSTGGMCSKCFRETQGVDAAVAAVARPHVPQPTVPKSPEPKPLAPAAETPAAAVAASPEANAAGSSSGPTAPSPNPCRCNEASCRKKLGLTGFKCKCGMSFCGTHRHAEGHACTFDYKALGRTQIADNNPIVQASKVQKL